VPPPGYTPQDPQYSPYAQQQPTQQYSPDYGQQQQYPGYGSGPEAYQDEPLGGPRKTGLIWTAVAVVVVLLVAVGVLGFLWAPWTPNNQGFFNQKVLDSSAVQDGVKGILQNDYKLNVSSVSCPADEAVTKGNSFTCTATIDGQQKSVQITVQDDAGHYEVAQPK
jgi:hypothetical protein